MTEWSEGEVTLTIFSSWVCSSRLQPTPQKPQIVSVTFWLSGFQELSSRISCSVLKTKAPVGQTPMQLHSKHKRILVIRHRIRLIYVLQNRVLR